MQALEWVGLTLAFLGPMPPRREEPPERLPGNEWAAALIIGSLCVITIVPMVTIWSFHRPRETARARCEASGGHLTLAHLDGPARCERDGSSLKR